MWSIYVHTYIFICVFYAYGSKCVCQVNRFDKQFNLGGFYDESSDHSVSDEIAKVTGLDAYSDEPEPAKHQKEAVGMRQVQAPPLLEDSDSFHQMRMYAEQMEQLSPPMVSPATTPGNPYLKAPPTHVSTPPLRTMPISIASVRMLRGYNCCFHRLVNGRTEIYVHVYIRR